MAPKEQVGLPGYRDLRCRTLEVIRELPMPANNGDIDTAVADSFGLTAEQRLLPHGEGAQTELAYRIAWARSGLVAAGALENVSKALWRVTPAGREMTCSEVERARREYLRKIQGNQGANFSPPKRRRCRRFCTRGLAASGSRTTANHVAGAFERLAGRLLESAGFDEVQVTGKVADGGIDAVGVYRPSGLISFRTSVQCKRWQGSVGSDRVQAFQGASMPKSDRGIIITTGTFTTEARGKRRRQEHFPLT